MNFEDLQKAWQAQDTAAQLTVSSDVLLKEVRRNQQQFRATIFWRDAREVGVAVLLFLYFTHRGWHNHDWTDGLVGVACLGIAVFMIVDRLIQHRKRPAANNSLKSCAESSLHQVNHQIWLLKNVFWWYLLPLAAALGISVCASAWHSRHSPSVAAFWLVYTAVCVLIFWGVYRLNQAAVRRSLEPRREELEALLAGLD